MGTLFDLWQRFFASLVRALLALLRWTPRPISYGLGSLGALAVTPLVMLHGSLVSARRTSVSRNLRIAFGSDMPTGLIWRLVFGLVRHYFWFVIDTARVSSFDLKALSDGSSVEDRQTLVDLVAEGKGVIFVTGHIGVFAYGPQVGALLELPLQTITNSVGNPHLQSYIDELYMKGGHVNLYKRGVARTMRKILDGAGSLAIMADENVKSRELFLPFFGTLASVQTTVARLHLSTGAPIVVAVVHRPAPGAYGLTVYGVIRHESSGDRGADVKVIMGGVTEALEKAVRAHPEQWSWNMRRWKTRPEGEEPAADGLPPRVLPPELPR